MNRQRGLKLPKRKDKPLSSACLSESLCLSNVRVVSTAASARSDIVLFRSAAVTSPSFTLKT
jgi:hypothetical protein